MKLFLLIPIFIISLHSICQDSVNSDMDFKNIDLKSIEENVKDTSSGLFLETLLDRYLKQDTTLDLNEYKHLYYGYTYSDAYEPYGGSYEIMKKVNNILEKKKVKERDKTKIIKLLKQGLNSNPFDLDLMWLLFSLLEEKKDPESSLWLTKFRSIIEVVMNSGDGMSCESAITIIHVEHEYIILQVLGFEFDDEQSLIDKCDYLKVKPNQYGVSGVYFNIERLWDVNVKKLFSN